MAAIQESLRTGKTYQAHYRLAPRSDEEERWVEAVASVIQENGAPVRLLGICRDVTDRQKLLRELRVRAKQQETVARLGERALTETDLQKLFDDMVATVAEILDVEFVKILELVPGDAELLLRAGVGWSAGLVGTAHETHRPPLPCGLRARLGRAGDRHRPEIRDAVRERRRCCAIMASTAACRCRSPAATGAPTACSARTRARRRRFGEYDVAFLSAIANMIAGAIQRQQSDQRHELMIRELRHRSGNLFAQLLALFSQTARTSRSVPDLMTKYQARVLALANAHRLITEGGWRATSLTDLLRLLLTPYLERVTLVGSRRVSRAGPLLRALLRGARACDQCGEIRQPVRFRTGSSTLELDGQSHRAGHDARARLERTRRPAAAARAAHRLRVAPDRHGDRAPARRASWIARSAPEGLDARLTIPLTHERWPQPLSNARGGR